MTIRAPGQECLTKTQELQRQLQARLRADAGLPQTATQRDIAERNPLAVNVDPARAIEPAAAAQKTAASDSATKGRFVDIQV